MPDYDVLATEKANQRTKDIDRMTTAEMVRAFNDEDKKVALAVEAELDHIAAAIDAIAERMKQGGRLFYLGAGTSGRLGVLDASECPPTYGVSYETVQGVMVGGERAVFRAVEGARMIRTSASGSSPSAGSTRATVWSGCRHRATRRAWCGRSYGRGDGRGNVGHPTNPGRRCLESAEYPITPVVGPEVINGSTRMKSGTAQKMVLNMLSTGDGEAGTRAGNYMLYMKPTNIKLRRRAERIIAAVTGRRRDRRPRTDRERR